MHYCGHCHCDFNLVKAISGNGLNGYMLLHWSINDGCKAEYHMCESVSITQGEPVEVVKENINLRTNLDNLLKFSSNRGEKNSTQNSTYLES